MKDSTMRAISKFTGIDSMSMDMKEKRLTLIGDVDPLKVVDKLRKSWHTEIFSIGPASKEPEKKRDDQPSTSNYKKVRGEGGSGGRDKGVGGGGGDDGDQRRSPMMPLHYPSEQMMPPHYPSTEQMMPPFDHVRTYQAYPMMGTNYYVQSAEENPNVCVIC